jgi:hypothetical protein
MALTKDQWDTILRDFETTAVSLDALRSYDLEMLEEAARLYSERAAELRARASEATSALLNSLCLQRRFA